MADTFFFTVLLEQIQRHWLSSLLVLLTLAILAFFLILRSWMRREWRRRMEQGLDDPDLAQHFSPLNETDRKALEVIKKFRSETWELPEAQLSLSAESLVHRATQIVRAIAAIYHPDINKPEYEASLYQSLQLVQRVNNRLLKLSTYGPFKVMAHRKLSDYQQFYVFIQKINESSILKSLKRHGRLYRIASWMFRFKQFKNPIYWAGRELSKEGYFFMLRWFHATYVSHVGREAIKLYSGRPFAKQQEHDAALVCYRLFQLATRWGGPSAEEWAAFVKFINNIDGIDADTKIKILARCAQNRIPTRLSLDHLQTRIGQKWYRHGLRIMLKAGVAAGPEKDEMIANEQFRLGKVDKQRSETSHST